MRSVPGVHAGRLLKLVDPVPRAHSFVGTQFVFLNRDHEFGSQIDWDFPDHGKLWTYNLNYFDFLNQKGVTREHGLELIRHYIEGLDKSKTAWEPYPSSLRLINWIKFLSREKVRDPAIDQSLYVQSVNLTKQLEYHLLGNHLLENGFALLFAAIFFVDDKFMGLATKILESELEEQILADGAHFELSPMYHQIILDRLLDCINLLQNNRPFGEKLLPLLVLKASAMLGWLEQMTFSSGAIPLFNDAAEGIAPTSDQLFSYAERLDVKKDCLPLGESGYRCFNRFNAELVVDVGLIGPDYIPGHAHADTLNFELALFGQRVIVDTGISTYEKNTERQRQRGTAAHNTLTVNGQNSSEVWGGFRVARRARPFDLSVTNTPETVRVSCSQDGYRRLKGHPVHKRTWLLQNNSLRIEDFVTDHFAPATTRVHFHPDVDIVLHGTSHGHGHLSNGKSFAFSIVTGVAQLVDSTYHPAFNRCLENKCLEIIVEGGTAVMQFEWGNDENPLSH